MRNFSYTYKLFVAYLSSYKIIRVCNTLYVLLFKKDIYDIIIIILFLKKIFMILYFILHNLL